MAITTITNPMVSVNAIQGTLIADNAITAVHIATNAVSGTLIADNAVTATHIAQNTITVTQLADDAVEADKIADGVITTNHLNKAMISSQTEVTPVAGDFVLLGDTSDSNNLKKAPLTLLLNSNVDISGKADLAGPTFTGDVDISGTDDLRLRFLNSGTFKGGIQVPTSTGDMISGAAVDDLAIRSQGNILFSSGGNSEMMRIQSTGKVGIGTAAAPDTQLHVKNTGGIELRLEADSNNSGQEDCFVRFYTDGKTQEGIAGMDNNNSSTLFSGNTENAMVFGTVSNLPVVFATNNTERMQITNDGSVGIGGAPGATLDVNNTTASDNRTVAIIEGKGNASSTADGGQYLSITRTGPISSASGNVCGGLLLANGSSITGQANCGIRGTYEYTNGRDIEFFTSADNSTAPTTKMQLKGNGNLALGNQIEPQGDSYLLSAYGTVVTCWFENRSTTAAHEVMILNRKESAGTMIAFLYNDSEKGTITQSGGTISYNPFMGSHYSESSEDTSTILHGTVMETVDALVENKYEDEKRLAKCKVSSTSESPNVYGVWMEDNETGQIAALGASWCRINSGVTVSMGDLLVSNGDGTAKVQSDDIIRSKTIGKVTATAKKETYSDGSYVVPVVLYCG